MASQAPRRISLIERESAVSDVIYLSDVRHESVKDEKLSYNDNATYDTFKQHIVQLFNLTEDEPYVITTTYREEITPETLGYIEAGDTLYILRNKDQELQTQTKEKVNYLPHYDTIVKGGMYEYYASEGQNPLPYAFAELIDNALAATAENVGTRDIEIRLHLEDDQIFVIDNGKGMTSRQLNNWAVYRLSKFIRQDTPSKVPGATTETSTDSFLQMAPRSLNSDISYFGVGGKQAIFFIGSATTMITKVAGSPDVHELSISREQFEKKEQNKEEIYSGFIRNRKPGDFSHIGEDDEILQSLIREEVGKESFTVVSIKGLNPQHIPYLKANVKEWNRQLAHIYHYYIHGPNGNVHSGDHVENGTGYVMADEWFTKINLNVAMYSKSLQQPVVYELRKIEDDVQSCCIQSAASTFEFKAIVEGTGVAEGVLRYHPFLYDKETFPVDFGDQKALDNEMEDAASYISDSSKPARGSRPIFECYWNGRLIPYTFIDEFDWCSVPKKTKTSCPAECFNRVSGVVWTNDKFQVSTNKLTFIDLEVKLRDKQTVFCRVVNKNNANTWERVEKRTDVAKEFQNWLKTCHETLDKQIKFFDFKQKSTRPELPKARQSPWAVYSKIEWDGKLYQEGTLVRIHKTLPILYGSIKQIWLYGDHEDDVYATGGELEVFQEPRTLYDEVKFVSIGKMDRNATDAQITKYISDEEKKLPEKLVYSWPSGEEVKQGDKRAAGRTIGDIKVEIINCKGESINKLPGSQQRKLLVELKVLWHSSHGDQVLNHHISQHGKNWGYWFKKMENINSLGTYTIHLQCVLNESGVNHFGKQQLPSEKITFTVTEAEAVKFTLGMMEGPFRVGVPFNVPVEFQDNFGNQTKPSTKYSPVIEAKGLKLKYEEVSTKGSSLLISNVTAETELGKNALQGKSYDLIVKVPELNDHAQSLKIRLLPGAPHSLHVSPDSLEIENGDNINLNIEVRDCAGNLTAYPRASATVKFAGATGTPTYSVDCSKNGHGTLSGKPVVIKKLKASQTIQARIELNSFRSVPAVEIPVTVEPSTKAALLTVSYVKDGSEVTITDGQDLVGTVGEPIKGIRFGVSDEAGRPKSLDTAFVNKIKVNWTPKLVPDSLLHGRLPDLKVPTNVSESKYCHISLIDGSGLDFSFTVRAVTGPPASLKCSCTGSNKVRLGETLASDVQALVMDKFGNHIKKLEKSTLKDLTITGDGLVEDKLIRGFGQVSGFNIEKIRFAQGELGHREVKVEWRGLEDFVRLEVVAGAPDKLTVLNWDHSQPITIYNNGKTPQPLIAQLCDLAGNPTEEENVKIQLTRDVGIRLTPMPQPMKTNKKGQANFGYFIVYGKCGVYEIQPKAFIGRSIICGPKLQLAIELDPYKAVKLEVNDVNGKSLAESIDVKAGEPLPELQVKVLAEDDSVMTTAKVACVRMKIMYTDTRPAYSIQPPDKTGNAQGHFTFSGRTTPEASGKFYLIVSYVDGVKYALQSEQVVLDVSPLEAESLVSVQDAGTLTVSNTKALASRTLVKGLELQLQDKFGNVVEDTGKSTIEIARTATSENLEIPSFVGGKLTIPLVKGIISTQSLVIEENTPGKDGQEYILRCCLHGKIFNKIAPYELPFLFYNDVKKQSQMAALSKERDSLLGVIRTYRSLFETTQQLVNELKFSVKEAVAEEQKLKAELRKLSIVASDIDSLANVDRVLEKNGQERTRLQEATRRTCGLPSGPRDAHVLGKIAHLAEIEDDDCARVLSWHMSADMDCVVTLTTGKAQDIHHQAHGKQQVLPLDSIYRKNLPDWNKPLPHVRLRPNWRPNGHPEYARDLLHFPGDPDQCKIVFGMLLGDTVILDTLGDANTYRQEIVKFTHCPTILTRDGDRIRSNGKFGGLMNKALPIDRLRGAVFGGPLPKQFYTYCKQIDLLQNFRGALQKRLTAEEDLGEQTKIQNTPEMRAKHRECEEAESQLVTLESRLGFSSPSIANTSTNSAARDATPTTTTTSTSRRRSMPAGRVTTKSPATATAAISPEPPQKRARSMANGGGGDDGRGSPAPARRRSSADGDSAPSRQSTRRAAAESSNAWQSLRKRQRRS